MKLLKIEHIQLTAPKAREKEARHFYERVLGLVEIPRTGPPSPVIWYGLTEETRLRLMLTESFSRPSGQYVAILVDDLNSVKAALAEHEVPYEPSPVLSGYERIFVRDPFGNALEFLETGA